MWRGYAMSRALYARSHDAEDSMASIFDFTQFLLCVELLVVNLLFLMGFRLEAATTHDVI
jgi:hypothetical protein